MGLRKNCLVPVKMSLKAVNGEGINILGATFLRVSGVDKDTNKKVETAVMAYVTDSTDNFYLSKQTMRKLGIIARDFPSIRAQVNGCETEEKIQVEECDCPPYSKPPKRPEQLLFEPIPKNIGVMKDWLVKRFSTSTFNKCIHRERPIMDCEPMRIHVDPKAKPQAVHRPTQVPIHWKEPVSAQLKKDLARGVIEKVPMGVPSVWQARMVLAAKEDESPR